MEREESNSGKNLGVRVAGYVAASGLSSIGILALYLFLLSDLDGKDWSVFALTTGLVGAVVCGVSIAWARRVITPITEWLNQQENKQGCNASTLAAFKLAIALPLSMQWTITAIWSGASIMVAIVLALVGGPAWGLGVRSFVIIVGGGTAAALAGFMMFFALKRDLEGVRREMAMQIPNAEDRRNRIHKVSISRKLSSAMVGTMAAMLILAMTLAHTKSQDALDDVAVKWQGSALQAVVDELDPSSFEEAVAAVVGDKRELPYPIYFELLEPGAKPSGSEESRAMHATIEALVEAGTVSGSVRRLHQDSLWAYHDLPDGRIVASRIARADVSEGTSPILPSMLFVLLIAVAGVIAIVRLISEDMRRSIVALRETADTMARGDLRRSRILESEDELGDLWRAFETMSTGFRSTVKSLADAADRFDATAGEISIVADGVTSASEQQVRRIQQASELMVSINSQVMEVAGSAQDLNLSVEESSSSILELGSAGDELNDTASVLGGKVEEVSSSIEQMVRSVKQVSSSSDGLADVAAETSASMEEMASAMRAVDTTAELTANLSRNVVESAELGQAKVSQTIDGMQAIRDATDTAEKVIRGLGARTKEIGAILDVIDDVAEETNLLALNAAIIAAQAGEHGRAFSVVADEIKELADRVLASTKEIGGLIRAVQDESDNAVGAIEVGSQSVASGVELSAEAGLSLEEITSSSRESGQRIAEIVSAVREQTKAASHVVALMDTVRDGVTAIVSAAADQDRGNEVVYRSSITMREVTQQVRRTTEEQSRGFGRIRGSIEGVREVVENVNGSLNEQSTACSQVAEFLDEVFERTRSNEDAAKAMGNSIRGLASQAEALREHVGKFKI